MAGLLDAFTPQTVAPQHTIIPIDQGTNNLINQAGTIAAQTPEQFAQQQNQGVADAAHQAQQSDAQAAQQNARSGYSNDAINGAIRNQYNQQAGSRVQQIQEANNQNAVFEKAAATQRAAAEAMARQNVTTSSYEKLMSAYNATETARAQVLSSILGAGGMAAGMYAGNRAGRHRGGVPNVSGTPGQIPGGTLEGNSMQSLGASGIEGESLA